MNYGVTVDYRCSKEADEWIREFKVVNPETNVAYRCRTKLFLPLMISDIVAFNTMEHLDPKELNIISFQPFVRLNPEWDFTNTYLKPALKKYPASLLSVYEYLCKKTNSSDPETLVQWVEEMVRWSDKGKTFDDALELFEPKVLDSLLAWFKRNVCIRKFKLLNLTNDEIRELFLCHEQSTYDLYRAIVENPYYAYPAGFQACLKIAAIVNYKPTAEDVIKGQAIVDLYKYVKNNGWTCISENYASEAIINDKDFYIQNYGLKWLGSFIYFPITYRVEIAISKWFKKQLTLQTPRLEVDESLCTPDQTTIIKNIFNNPITIMMGEAGTGKTTLIALIIAQLSKHNVGYHVCSFTGKAVQRAMQVANADSKNFTTIHRLLAMKDLNFQFLIIDEVSMVSMPLFYQLVNKLKNKEVQVLLVGDPNQLEPIEWGHMLETIIHSKNLQPHIIRLNINYRQQGNGLLDTVRDILTSKEIYNSKDQAFTMIQCVNEVMHTEVVNIVSKIKTLYPNDKIMILCPYLFYLKRINSDVRPLLRLTSFQDHCVTDTWGTEFHLGDKVMLTENDEDGIVFNGDEGVVTSIGKESLTVLWNRTGTYNLFSLNSEFEYEEMSLSLFGSGVSKKAKSTKLLQISYAITCHKSQGSEWDGVIFALPYRKGNQEFVNKRMVYTALTRAKKYAYVIGDIKCFKQACKSDPVITSTLLPYHVDVDN